MWQTIVVLMCCSIGAANEPEKPKPVSPREKRGAAEKAIKAKMAPLEKQLAGHKEDLEATKRAPVDGRGQGSKRIGNIGDDRIQYSNFLTAENKQKEIDRHVKAIEQLTAQLKPLQEQLKALKRPQKPAEKPEPKPEPKPKEPEKAPDKK